MATHHIGISISKILNLQTILNIRVSNTISNHGQPIKAKDNIHVKRIHNILAILKIKQREHKLYIIFAGLYMPIGCFVLQFSCKSIKVARDCQLATVVIAESSSSKHGKINWFTNYLKHDNVKNNAQCVHTIALVCSPKIGNDRQPWKPWNKLTMISYPEKILRAA